MAEQTLKGGPGKKPASNILRVSDPNDSRLQMYKDSVTATGRAIADAESIKKMAAAPNEEAKKMFVKGVSTPPEASAAISRLEMANRKPYKEGLNRSAKPATIEAAKGYGYNKGDVREVPGGKFEVVNVYPKNIVFPKREVIYEKPAPKPKPKPAPTRKVSEPIEPMESRKASLKISTPEMVAPVVRPAKAEKPAVVAQKTEPRKMPKAVMPTKQGGWSKQSAIRRTFPNLFAK